MKKLIVLAILSFVLLSPTGAIAADALPVIETVSSPDSGINGLAWDSGHLWGSFHYSFPAVYKGMILKFDMSGNIVTSFEAPGYKFTTNDKASTEGLAFDGTYLWNLNYTDDKIYKLTTSGEVIESFDILNGSSGIAWDGENLWISNVTNYKIYKVSPVTGEILHTINAPKWENDKAPHGMAFDGAHLWISNTAGVYKIDTASGSIIEEYKSLGYGKADGLTWDGEYLWSGGTASSAVKKLDVGAGVNIPVANAGDDQTIFNEVTLDGSASGDADGSIVSYQWQLNHKENSDYNTTAEGMTPTVSNLKKGFYDVTLTVTNNDGNTGSDTMLLGASGRDKIDLSAAVYILQVLSGNSGGSL